MNTAFRYVLFAILSTLVNFGAQQAVVMALPTRSLMPSMFAGTIAGFAVKYLLDKYWIFFDGYSSPGNEARKVTLYGLFSVLTTLIFWASELAFWTIWQTDLAKYAGGTLGLAFGYTLKYQLDRRYVFRPSNA